MCPHSFQGLEEQRLVILVPFLEEARWLKISGDNRPPNEMKHTAAASIYLQSPKLVLC